MQPSCVQLKQPAKTLCAHNYRRLRMSRQMFAVGANYSSVVQAFPTKFLQELYRYVIGIHIDDAVTSKRGKNFQYKLPNLRHSFKLLYQSLCFLCAYHSAEAVRNTAFIAMQSKVEGDPRIRTANNVKAEVVFLSWLHGVKYNKMPSVMRAT